MMFAWPKDQGEAVKIDGDNPDHVKWLTDKATLRAQVLLLYIDLWKAGADVS